MNTAEIMQASLDMAGFDKIPEDSGVWYPGSGIKKVLFAIDAGVPELLVARELGYDLLIAHHPVGPARLTFPKVVNRHIEFMVAKGVPEKVARAATKELVEKIEVNSHPANYMHDPGVAKALRMPFMNIHLPIDQVTRDILLKRIERASAETVGELVEDLGKMPEFRKAKTRIEVRLGSREAKLGNWVLVFAAGTNGGYPVAKAYYDHGVDTVIYLHVDFESLAKLRNDGRGSLIVLGHMAGDSIGINAFLNALRRKGLEVDCLDVVN